MKRRIVANASPRVIASALPDAAYFAEKIAKKDVKIYAKINFTKDSRACDTAQGNILE